MKFLPTCANQQIATNFVSVQGQMLKAQCPVALTAVYGPQTDADKITFLNELKTHVQRDLLPDVPTMIVGDFNLIASAADKNNRNINRRTMGAFRRFINELQLKDIYLHGRRYTWSNEQAAATMVKLDRVLINDAWDSAFSRRIAASSIL